MKTKLFISALVLMFATVLVNAQEKTANQDQQNTTNRGIQWVDSDNDGICDNFEARRSSGVRGMGQGYMRGGRQGQRFLQGAGQGQRMGMGPRGMRQGRGQGRNYVDANNNGICDYRETPVKK